MRPVAWLIGVGLVGLIGGAAIVYFWDDILEWLSDFLPKVANLIREIGRRLGPNTQYATDMMAEKLDNIATAIKHHLYYKQNGQWIEETTRRVIPESELPPHIRKKVRTIGQDVDITDDIERETRLTV